MSAKMSKPGNKAKKVEKKPAKKVEVKELKKDKKVAKVEKKPAKKKDVKKVAKVEKEGKKESKKDSVKKIEVKKETKKEVVKKPEVVAKEKVAPLKAKGKEKEKVVELPKKAKESKEGSVKEVKKTETVATLKSKDNGKVPAKLAKGKTPVVEKDIKGKKSKKSKDEDDDLDEELEDFDDELMDDEELDEDEDFEDEEDEESDEDDEELHAKNAKGKAALKKGKSKGKDKAADKKGGSEDRFKDDFEAEMDEDFSDFEEDLDLDDFEEDEVKPKSKNKKELEELGSKIYEEVLNLAEDYDFSEIQEAIKDIDFFNNADSDECLEKSCENLHTTLGYCRYHYIKHWKDIKRKETILKEGKLQLYIQELIAKYPQKYIESILSDLSDEKEFYKTLRELNIDTNFQFEEFAGDDESEEGDLEVETRAIGKFNYEDEEGI
ncbi:MAG: hypothetical protein U0T83_07810 [Bacteriovoracaceae bacterium]